MGDVPADPVRCLRVGERVPAALSVHVLNVPIRWAHPTQRNIVLYRPAVWNVWAVSVRWASFVSYSDGNTVCMLGEPDGTNSIAELGEPGGMHASAMQCIKLTDKYVKTAKAQGMSREAYTLWLPILLRDLRLTGLPPAGLLPMGPFPVLKRLEFRGRSQMRAKVSGVLTA